MLSVFEDMAQLNSWATDSTQQPMPGKGKSLEDRTGAEEETRKLVTHIGASVSTHTTAKHIIRPFSINTDFKVDVNAIRGALVALYDTMGN